MTHVPGHYDYTSPPQTGPSGGYYGANISGEQRVRLLEASGFRWLSGQAQGALWETPDGRVLLEEDALQETARVPRAEVQPRNEPSTMRYDAQGQAFQWDGQAWQRMPQFDDPTKVAGYQAPRAGAAPPQPDIQIADDGTVVRLDP